MTDLKLILADIDGTLVNEPRDMGELTKAVLKHLHDKGVHMGIASGRPLDELGISTEKFDIDMDWDFLVGMNGGEVYDALLDSTSIHYPLSEEVIKEVLDLMKDFDFANPVIYRDHLLIARRYDEMLELSVIHARKQYKLVDSMEEFYSQPTGKIMLRTATPEECDLLEAFALAHPSANFDAFKTQPTLLEFQDPRVSKGVALRQIARDHGWSADHIAAFGDASNDNQMLADAGLGVCLCNGLEDTKACADELTQYDNEVDGMARYLLNKFPWYFEDFPYEIPDADPSLFYEPLKKKAGFD